MSNTSKKHSINSSNHIGHTPMIKEAITQSIKTLDDVFLKLAIYCDEMNLTETQVSTLIKMQSNGSQNFTPKRIRYAIERNRAERIIRENSSSAEKLLKELDQMREEGFAINYVAFIHDSEQGFHLKMPKGQKSKRVK
jgi:hypothetical protein